MIHLVSVYLLFNFVSLTQSQSRQRQNHQIEWKSSNPYFHLDKPFVLSVRLGDTIDFICPYSHNQSSSIEYNTLYLVSKIDYYLCLTENYYPLLRCDQPYSSKPLVFTLSIAKYLPYPNVPEFLDGYSYYFISTSNGQKSGLDQKFDGLCRSKNFRFAVDVQKYYRRYSTNHMNNQYRIKLQRQVYSNQTHDDDSQQNISSQSIKLIPSLLYLLFYTFQYLYI